MKEPALGFLLADRQHQVREEVMPLGKPRILDRVATFGPGSNGESG
ncbi:hypothetical protein NG796_22945 [Laspinema sp. A4]|nr:hypothetical protein [Laspinema sp. D2d]